jgi:hypothetical protein
VRPVALGNACCIPSMKSGSTVVAAIVDIMLLAALVSATATENCRDWEEHGLGFRV